MNKELVEFYQGSTEYAQAIFNQAGMEHTVDKLAKQFGLNIKKTHKSLLGDGAVSLTETDAPSSNDLDDLLNNVGKAKSNTSITTVPDEPSSYDITLLQNVQTLESYISVLTALVMYNKHPEMYDLSKPDQATQFVVDSANAKNYVMSGGTVKDIAMYLPGMEVSTQTKSISTTSADLHVDLLNALFGSMGLPQGVFKQLDGILTEINKSLQNLKMSFETQSETLNHCVNFYYLKPVEGAQPPINEMHVKFLYLQIDQKSWKASIGKSSVEHFSFNMILTQTDSVMNSGLVSGNTANIIESLQSLTSKDPSEISKMVDAKGVKEDGK